MTGISNDSSPLQNQGVTNPTEGRRCGKITRVFFMILGLLFVIGGAASLICACAYPQFRVPLVASAGPLLIIGFVTARLMLALKDKEI